MVEEEERGINVERNFRLYDEDNPDSQSVKCRNFLDFLKALAIDMVREHWLYKRITQPSFVKIRIIGFILCFILFLVIKAMLGINLRASAITLSLYGAANGTYYYLRYRNSKCAYIMAIIGVILIISQIITDGVLDSSTLTSNKSLLTIYIIVLYCHLQLDCVFSYIMEYPSALLVFLVFCIIYPFYYCIYKAELEENEKRREERRRRRIQMELEAPRRPEERNLERIPPPYEPADMNSSAPLHIIIPDEHPRSASFEGSFHGIPEPEPTKFVHQMTGFKFQSRAASQRFEEKVKSTAVRRMCIICLEEFVRGERIAQLQCHKTHIFHSDCINAWKSKNNQCPLCRAIGQEVVLKEYTASVAQPPTQV